MKFSEVWQACRVIAEAQTPNYFTIVQLAFFQPLYTLYFWQSHAKEPSNAYLQLANNRTHPNISVSDFLPLLCTAAADLARIYAAQSQRLPLIAESDTVHGYYTITTWQLSFFTIKKQTGLRSAAAGCRHMGGGPIGGQVTPPGAAGAAWGAQLARGAWR